MSNMIKTDVKQENSLILTKKTFFEMLSDLIKSGVTFTAKEVENEIHVIFTGGY